MTSEAIAKIGELLRNSGINYEFGRWTASNIPSVYWVGEYSESESMNEDGLNEAVMILTGFTTDSFANLQKDKETINLLFPSIFGKAYELPNGSMLAVYYGTANVVPVDDLGIKRLEIQLTIKEWMVN